MKILHAADIHFSNKKSILQDIVKCTRFLLEVAEKEKPDLIAIAGDIFEESVNLGSLAALSAVDFVLRAGHIAPVLIVRGTPTHDVGDCLHVFGKLNTCYPVYVTETVEQICLPEGFRGQGSGFRELFTDPCPLNPDPFFNCRLLISCLPSISKGNLLAMKNVSLQEGNLEMVDLLRDVFQSWGVVNSQARQLGIPTVIVGHGTVLGTTLSTGQQMVGRDIEFSISDLRLAGADLVCLGHIHKTQLLGDEVFYNGSITRLNYGEVEEKGFYLHDVFPEAVSSRFISTPARIMKTISCDSLPTPEALDGIQSGDFVRITYAVPEEDIHKVDEEQLRRIAMEKGVEEIKIEKTIIPKVRVRAEGISQIKSLDEKLLRWGETVGQNIPQGVLDKLALLEGMEEESLLSSLGL